MASKNNPAIRETQKLVIYCPDCENEEVKIVKVVAVGGSSNMFYRCAKCGLHIPERPESYKELRHEWIARK
jgi:uncharacterized Zn finger protein